MSKIIILTILLAVNCQWIQAAAVHNHEDVEFFSDRLENVIKTKCMANADEKENNEAIEALKTFKGQWQIALPAERLFGVAFYNYCVNKAQNFTTYLVNLVDSVLPCLSTEEQFLKPFIINGYGDYNQHLCKFMELLTVSESKKKYNNKCDEIMNSNHELNPYYACYKDSKIFGDNATISVITKQELCEDILDIRCCYDKIFEENCPEIPEYADLLRVLLTQSLTHCVDELESSEENSSEKHLE